MAGIGIGTTLSWYKSTRNDAEKLARALTGVSQQGTRSLWNYPDHGSSKGAPRRFGNLILEYVSVYWDGKAVWLSLAGPGAPKSNTEVFGFLSSIGVNVTGTLDVFKSNTML